MLNILLLIWIKISLNQNVIQNYNVGYIPRKPFSSTLLICEKNTVVCDFINIMKTTLDLIFLFISSLETACIEKKESASL